MTKNHLFMMINKGENMKGSWRNRKQETNYPPLPPPRKSKNVAFMDEDGILRNPDDGSYWNNHNELRAEHLEIRELLEQILENQKIQSNWIKKIAQKMEVNCD